MESHSAVKRNETETFSDTWIYLETDTQSEVSQKEKIKHNITYMLILVQMNLSAKRNRDTDIENKLVDTTGVRIGVG